MELRLDGQESAVLVAHHVNAAYQLDVVLGVIYVVVGNDCVDVVIYEREDDGKKCNDSERNDNSYLSPTHKRRSLALCSAFYHLFFLLTITNTPAQRAMTTGTMVRTRVY